ncbi:MAG: hypothetical protein KC766_01025 [Myxococcales bacterium]|nr:hypothetical protein [Myxococcales bacterium]
MTQDPPHHPPSIWWFAFGYFACYVPYSALTKAISSGTLPHMDEAVPGFELLPITTVASMFGMLSFLWLSGWWRAASRQQIFGASLPLPGRWTFLSGLCTAAIIGTTTLAYTFEGASIVFMMLLMRGGVLVIAPIVDTLSKRRVRWFSWVALGLSLSALLTALLGEGHFGLTLVAAVDVLIYLMSYFIRLRFMSRLAKSSDVSATKRYFVEEQMTAAPAIVLTLIVLALLASVFPGSAQLQQVRAGFGSFFDRGLTGYGLVIGLLSQGTGIFGGLILLDGRENSFCVPVNRASSVLAGLLASLGLYLWLGTRFPSAQELFGAILVISAILFLSVPPLMEKRRARRG